MINVKFTLDPGAFEPRKAHAADAGFDLRAKETVETDWGEGTVIDTGVHISIPENCVGIVAGRSGLNVNESIFCPPGIIDSGYTGSIRVKLYKQDGLHRKLSSLDKDRGFFERGDKVAQLLIVPLLNCTLEQVDTLEETERGDNGFGSTGR